jgi:hypothetical protein
LEETTLELDLEPFGNICLCNLKVSLGVERVIDLVRIEKLLLNA